MERSTGRRNALRTRLLLLGEKTDVVVPSPSVELAVLEVEEVVSEETALAAAEPVLSFWAKACLR